MSNSNTNKRIETILPKKELLEKAVYHYELLDADQKKVIGNKEIAGSMPVQGWIDKLENLVAYDFWADEYLKHYPKKLTEGCGVFFYILFYFIYFIWGITLMLSFDLPIYLIVIIGVVPLISFGFNQYIRYKRKIPQLRKQDLPNHFRDFVVPLLRIFKDEMSANAPLNLKLNMKKPISKMMLRTEKEHLLETERENYNSSKNTKFYEYPILDLKAKLINKIFINFSLGYIIRERYRYKRKGSKYKLRARGVFLLKMVVPKKSFKMKETTQLPEFIQLRESESRYIFKAKTQSTPYATRLATKGNKPSEYWNLQKEIFDNQEGNITLILKMTKEIYNCLEETQATT